MLLWPNSSVDEDATWYGIRPRCRPHCIRRVPSAPRKGHSTTPLFYAHVYCGHGRPSQLLLSPCLKEAREVAVVTLVGRLFHARAAITRKDRSPMVLSRVLGTITYFIIVATRLRCGLLFTHATLASMGISCCLVSVCPSVTRRCSTGMAKRRIKQTMPHDSPGTRFLMVKISAKLKQCHSQCRCQMQVK